MRLLTFTNTDYSLWNAGNYSLTRDHPDFSLWIITRVTLACYHLLQAFARFTVAYEITVCLW